MGYIVAKMQACTESTKKAMAATRGLNVLLDVYSRRDTP